MDTLTLVAALILAGVFGVAGVAKLRDRKGTREAVRAFGAPALLVPAIALVLPLAELAVAGALLFPATRFAGAVGALGLLVLFSAAIAVSLARGKTPDCHCFGQLHSAPTSWKTLARNGLLGALAGGLVIATRSDAGPLAVGVDCGTRQRTELGLIAGVLAVAALITALGASFLALTRAYGRVLLRLDATERALEAAGSRSRAARLVGCQSSGSTPGRPHRVRDAALECGAGHARRPPRPGASAAARLHEPRVRAVPCPPARGRPVAARARRPVDGRRCERRGARGDPRAGGRARARGDARRHRPGALRGVPHHRNAERGADRTRRQRSRATSPPARDEIEALVERVSLGAGRRRAAGREPLRRSSSSAGSTARSSRSSTRRARARSCCSGTRAVGTASRCFRRCSPGSRTRHYERSASPRRLVGRRGGDGGRRVPLGGRPRPGLRSRADVRGRRHADGGRRRRGGEDRVAAPAGGDAVLARLAAQPDHATRIGGIMSSQFDDLARALVTPTSRRRAFRLLGSAAARCRHGGARPSRARTRHKPRMPSTHDLVHEWQGQRGLRGRRRDVLRLPGGPRPMQGRHEVWRQHQQRLR